MTPPDLAGIIERDAQWDDVSPDALPSPIADRRALLGLLRETREALLHQAMRRHTVRDNCAGCRNVKAQIADALAALGPLP